MTLSESDAEVGQAHGRIFHGKKKTPAPGYGQGTTLFSGTLPGLLTL